MNEIRNRNLESPVALPVIAAVRGEGRYSQLPDTCMSLTPKYLDFHILTFLKSRGMLKSVTCPGFMCPARIKVGFPTDGV